MAITNLVGSTNSSAALLTVLTPTPSCDGPPSGIVAWWPGQGNGVDIIGGNNATVPAGVTYSNSEVGLGFSFDGSEFLAVSNQPAFNTTNALTIECWAYTRGHSVPQSWGQELVTKDAECSGARQYQLIVGDSQVQSGAPDFRGGIWLSGGLVNIDGATVVQTNTWYHVAMTYDGTTFKLYVNGVLDGQHTASGPITVVSGAVRLGGGERLRLYAIQPQRTAGRTSPFTTAPCLPVKSWPSTTPAARASALRLRSPRSSPRSPLT